MKHVHALVLLALSGAACSGEPEDTDPVDEQPSAPMINLLGEWWLPISDRLPNQDEAWCTDLTPERFDDSRCFTEPETCEQGLIFDSPNGQPSVEWIVIVQATECGNDLPAQVHAQTRYASFEWLGRNESGDADRYRVNAREWVVREDVDAQQEVGDAVIVASQDLTFRMSEDYRWED